MEKKKWQKLKIIFIALFFACSLIPFALLPWFGNQEAESDDADVVLKPLMVDGKLNKGFFTDETGKFYGGFAEDTGNWFSKKFAFRREMVDAGDRIKANVFRISGQSGVTMGKNGYLFYSDSFNNFLGRDQLTDYELSSIVYNVELMQELLTEEDREFRFTIAPNKNTLYPELMPDRYDPDIDNRNISRLTPMLEKSAVNYVDLYELFPKLKVMKDDVIYHKGDSHWNNEGAERVAALLAKSLGKEHSSHSGKGSKVTTRTDFKGDLYKMLYPATDEFDPEIYYDDMEPAEYGKRVSVSLPDYSNMGILKEIDVSKNKEWSTSEEIETAHKEKRGGSLLMIRDSFGNSLAPFVADDYGEATFLNNKPYDIGRALTDGRETVIFEIVERNLDRLLEDAAVISAKSGMDKSGEKALIKKAKENSGYEGRLEAESSETQIGYMHVTGDLDRKFTDKDTKAYIALKDKESGETMLFRAFRTSRRSDREEDAGEDEVSPDKAYGLSSYISEEDVAPGEYELSLIYGAGKKWNKTKALGQYEHAV